MSSSAMTEVRAAIAAQMRAEGKSYDEIAKALHLRSRGHVNYYLNRDKRREEKREQWKNYKAARGELPKSANTSNRDLTRFRPETPQQSAMWCQLLRSAGEIIAAAK